jgi:hypothetical protein
MPIEPDALPNRPDLPSDRTFGLSLGTLAALVGGVGWWNGDAGANAAFTVAVLLAGGALVAPRALRPLNIAWARLGALLNRVVSPVVLAVIFFGVLTPYSVVMRVMGRDALRRRADRSATTYWIERDQPGPDANSFPNQF